MLTVNRIVGRGLLLGCLLVSLGAGRTVLAREPVITSNLGGLAISCSIHRDQAAVAGVTTGSTQSQVEEILGMPQSVQYGRGTMEYSYPSRTLLLVHFSPERPYVLTDLKTSKWGDGTPDRVQVGRPMLSGPIGMNFPKSPRRTMPGTTPGWMKRSMSIMPTRPRHYPLRSAKV